MVFERAHTESTIKLDTFGGWVRQGPSESIKTVVLRIDHCKTAVKAPISMHPGLNPQREAHFFQNVRQTAARGRTVTRHKTAHSTKGGFREEAGEVAREEGAPQRSPPTRRWGTTRGRRAPPPSNRREGILRRDAHTCQYCGKRFPISELSIDHVLPQSRGGEHTWQNLVCSCVACNSRKGSRTPLQAGMRLVREPRRPRKSPDRLLRLRRRQYEAWKVFLNEAYWTVELRD